MFKINLHNNNLSSLDLRNGNNTAFYHLHCENNPNLTCISVDDASWSTANWITNQSSFGIDTQHYFSENCQ